MTVPWVQAPGSDLLLSPRMHFRAHPDCTQNTSHASRLPWYWGIKSIASNSNPWMYHNRDILKYAVLTLRGPARMYTLKLDEEKKKEI